MHNITVEDLPLSRLYRWERERGERVFLTQPSNGGKLRHWTWAQTADEIRRMAAYLHAQNWEPGTRVAIISRNCAWWIMADFAIWMAGHASVPIYPSLSHRSARYILEHSGAKACFLGAVDDKELAPNQLPASVQRIELPTGHDTGGARWDDVVRATPPLPGNPTRAVDDLATIIYTSGTTGTPKGVMHRFGAFAYLAKAATDLLGFTSEERLLCYLPLAHIVERCACETLGWYLGFHIYFTEGLETFLDDLKRAHPTIFPSVPRLLLKFQQGVFERIPQRRLEFLLRVPLFNRVVKRVILKNLGLDVARFAASGSAPLPLDLLLWYRNLGLNLFEGYGMSETVVTHLPAPGKVRPGFVGAGLEGVEAKLGPNDELLLRSPMNMLGYYRDPEGTRAAYTEDGFFRTGDVVQLDPDGQVKIIGRLKEQFKTSKGKYVAPAPLETRLATHPAIEACCVVGAGLASPVAVVLLVPDVRQRCGAQSAREAVEQTLRELMKEVNAELDPHERLGFIAVVDGPWTIGNEFLTPTLKIKRAVVEERYLSLVSGWQSRNCPVVWESEPSEPAREPLSATASVAVRSAK